jgi:hypothetical protein
MDLKRMGYEDVGCFNLAQDMDRCRTVENMVMNLRVP